MEDYLDVRLLTYISAKAIWGDIFGVSKVVPWGVKAPRSNDGDAHQTGIEEKRHRYSELLTDITLHMQS